jgi:hypothetical protein
MLGDSLTGSYRVRALKAALLDAKKTWPKTCDRMEMRRHALKLRYWPSGEGDGGQVLDLDWNWIKVVRDLRIGELRIDDQIGGMNNIRIIFFVGDENVKRPLPMIWILLAMIKKRDDFTDANIVTFKARRQIVIERCYKREEI